VKVEGVDRRVRGKRRWSMGVKGMEGMEGVQRGEGVEWWTG